MNYEKDPDLSIERKGNVLYLWLNNNPVKNAEGKDQWFKFERECASELEAEFLRDFLQNFDYELRKRAFIEGFNQHKKKLPNYYL